VIWLSRREVPRNKMRSCEDEAQNIQRYAAKKKSAPCEG
jgi:hypothetical protein